MQAARMTQIRESGPKFESMAFDELLSLRERLDDAIAQRIGAEERELEERLERIRRLKRAEEDIEPSFRRSSKAEPRKLPIRYRNPDNTEQVWAGRGLQPRWLKQALKSGKKLNHFLVVEEE